MRCRSRRSRPSARARARAPACERPTLSTTTGLPASAAAPQRVLERRRAAHRLEEQPDRARARVGREEGRASRRRRAPDSVPDETIARSPTPRPHADQRLADRARLHELPTPPSRMSSSTVPIQAEGPRGHREAHAVGADHRRAGLAQQRHELLARTRAGVAVLDAQAGHDEAPDAGGERVGDGHDDARGPDCDGRDVGQLGAGRRAPRHAAHARRPRAPRVDADRRARRPPAGSR